MSPVNGLLRKYAYSVRIEEGSIIMHEKDMWNQLLNDHATAKDVLYALEMARDESEERFEETLAKVKARQGAKQ
jgi:hypothetical protein